MTVLPFLISENEAMFRIMLLCRDADTETNLRVIELRNGEMPWRQILQKITAAGNCRAEPHQVEVRNVETVSRLPLRRTA
jgi:hypothetical protein